MNVIEPDKEGDVVNKIISRAGSQTGVHGDETTPESVVKVIFYRNGFTVGDGPLRPRGVAANDAFLADIEKGICPSELVIEGKPSAVGLMDMRGEDFVEPFRAFNGGGAQLTSDASSRWVIETNSSSVSPSVDMNAETVKLRISYVDTRKNDVITLNSSHTVQDLVNVVNASGNVTRNFQMLSSIRGPPQPLEMKILNYTLKEAGLAGAVVNVKQL